jgi:hypothetical protein
MTCPFPELIFPFIIRKDTRTWYPALGILIPRPGMTIRTETRTMENNINEENNNEFSGSPGES